MKVTITTEQIRELSDFLFDHVNFELPEDDEDGVMGAFRTYSGRGMYGAECLGIVVHPSAVFELGMAVDAWLKEEAKVDDLDELGDRFRRPSTDSMGYSTIVYWTGITVE